MARQIEWYSHRGGDRFFPVTHTCSPCPFFPCPERSRIRQPPFPNSVVRAAAPRTPPCRQGPGCGSPAPKGVQDCMTNAASASRWKIFSSMSAMLPTSSRIGDVLAAMSGRAVRGFDIPLSGPSRRGHQASEPITRRLVVRMSPCMFSRSHTH